MKRIIALALALVLALSLAACGGGNDDKIPSGSEGNTPSSQQAGQDTPDEGKDAPDNTTPKKEWPADQIPAWSGSGTITKIEDNSAYAKDYTNYYIVKVNPATLDEFTAYISELKSAGFSYKSAEEEPSAGYREDDYSYSWNGITTDGKRVQITLDKDDSKLEIAIWIE